MARSRSLIQVRKPPIDAVLALHKPRRPGICYWCGLEQAERTPVRKQLKLMHAACSFEMAVITAPDQARRALLDRDGGICCDCGGDFSQRSIFRPAHPVGHHWHIHWLDGTGSSTIPGEGAPYVRLTAVSMWEADHKVPLWKVAHMPASQRIDYFKLANLVTRCLDCHKLKSAEEAAERARFDEMAGENKPKVKRPWAKRQRFAPRPARDINDD